MTQDSHDFAWAIPDGAEPEYVPLPVFEPAGGMSAVSGGRRRRQSSRLRGLGALLILGLVVLATMVVVQARATWPPFSLPLTAPEAGPAPAWLVNRPFSAGLSPDLSPQCDRGGCHFTSASGLDLAGMRALVGGRFTVAGMRVSDSYGRLRGVAIYVDDVYADELTIDAVWVPRAPARWDGERTLLTGGAPASRWVLHTASGVWLVQAVAWGCGGGREWPTLTGLAVHRVHAARLSL